MADLTTDMKAFRAEVRDFCNSECPVDIKRRVRLGKHLPKEDFVQWQQILHKRGWFVAHWPAEHGGQGWGALQRFICDEELAKAGTPSIPPFLTYYIGPVLYTFGSAAQQARFLPPIRESRVWWCQGYSEPSAGSDLYSLRTRAVREGNYYRVTGQKMWTSTAHWADMIFALVRTSQEQKKQAGVSFLLIDLKSPGVTVRPIMLMHGQPHVNEIFFDDVMVPVENLVGEEGKAWQYSNFLLGNERVIIAELGVYKRMLRELRGFAGDIWEGGRPLSEDPSFGLKLAELEISLRVTEALCMKLLSTVQSGPELGWMGSVLKLRGTELQQTLGQVQIELLQRCGLPFRVEALSPQWEGVSIGPQGGEGAVSNYLYKRAATIFGGSSEIMRNILAKSALGF